jgi:hypothetical protein
MSRSSVSPWTFAKALRQSTTRQVFGDYIKYDVNGTVTGACAMGVIALQLQGHPTTITAQMNEAFGYGHRKCPKCARTQWGAPGMVVHLNDEHEAPFGVIAEWLETDAVTSRPHGPTMTSRNDRFNSMVGCLLRLGWTPDQPSEKVHSILSKQSAPSA